MRCEGGSRKGGSAREARAAERVARAGPSDIIANLTAKLNVSSDCSNYKDLPLLGFIVNGTVLNLEPSDYVDKDITGSY